VTASRDPAATPEVRKVLAFTGAFLPGYKAGGPIKSIVEMLDDLPASVKVTLVTSDRDLGDSMPYAGLSGRVVGRGHHEVCYLNRRSPRQWVALLRLARRDPVDLIYVNSLWSPQFTVLPILAHLLGLLPSREVLLAPRGELSGGALAIKSAKKRAFLRGWAPLLRRVDPVWHASTEMEETDIHQLFPGARTVIQADSRGDEPRPEIIRSGQRARFVFISRISKMKNLALALESLSMLKADTDFDIYGPVEDPGYWRQCQSLIADLPKSVQVRYLGELRPHQVKDTFAQYDAFILPTRGENFGHVIAESLSAGCPVICSQNTPWTQVLLLGGGTALGALDAGTLAEEIEARANRTPLQRDTAKRNALEAYAGWRLQQEKTSAVELALEGKVARNQIKVNTGPPQIALVTQGYQSTGGVQTVSRWLASGLREAGYGVHIFDLASSRADQYSLRLVSPATWRRSTLLEADSADHQVTHVGANAVELEPFRYLPRADLSAELSRYDLVQVVAGAPSLALAATRCRSPIVLQVATIVSWERASRVTATGRALALWRGAMTNATTRMEREALRRADAVLVLNDQMKEFVLSVSKTQVVMAPAGVDTERFTPRAEGWDSAGYLLSVCRLNDVRKGLDRMIRSYALMTTMRPSVPSLVLAGLGELPASLTQLMAELGVAGRISVRSDVSQTELPSLYRGASVYLQTSHEEGLGISVIEAMASGLPVVTTETAGTLVTVNHGETGWLVSQGSEVEAAIAERTLSI
jgi:glycosyltransferase involved in cell wall biosynthesis